MEHLSVIAKWIGEIGVILAVLIPIVVAIRKIINATKCQLRSEMLKIYYKCRKTGTIHQYDNENFVMLYEAYKALKGNSFIDKINEEVREYEVIP